MGNYCPQDLLHRKDIDQLSQNFVEFSTGNVGSDKNNTHHLYAISYLTG